ncbi:MAG: tetratricopeptide repeat protein, partial [Sulfuricaulis sp.]|nr:tetratricopeptide repeat protein [Sulfuricaulis sp.]
CYQRAIEIDPDYVEALCNLGVAFGRKGWRDPAIACYRRALQIKPDPDAHFNLALIYLLTGNFKEGRQEYAWHWLRENSAPRPLPPTPWDGSDLAGRSVFLHAEQGPGDEIFFLRFVNQLRQRGAGHIAYRPSKKIAGLLVRVPAIDRLVDPQAIPPPSDFVFSVGDLPKLLGMERVEQIPRSLALDPLPEKLEVLRAQLLALGPAPYLGVTWRAGTHRKDGVLFKECPVALLARTLREAPGTILVLQRHPEACEIEAFASALGRLAHDFSPLNEDLESMLALLALLDEYVGVSNTNMHLRAGAGKTARVLVPVPPEWRWMADGKESPWFPGFSVYRQGYDGDWEGAFAQLESDL